MKAMGLDISSNTGWSCIEDGKLIDYGTIQLNGGLELPQKLHYFHLELTRVLQRIQPETCFIEDVILGISGAKTLAYLGRLNGVAINAAFSVLQERVKLYTPDYWKAHSIPGLGGHAKKWEIQLAVINHFEIPITGDFEKIKEIVRRQEKVVEKKKSDAFSIRVGINHLKAELVRKRNPLSPDEIKDRKKKIKELESESKDSKSELKEIQRTFDKMMTTTCKDITAQTGMTPDICDSVGVVVCGLKELEND